MKVRKTASDGQQSQQSDIKNFATVKTKYKVIIAKGWLNLANLESAITSSCKIALMVKKRHVGLVFNTYDPSDSRLIA